MSSLLALEHVTKLYGPVIGVNDISLTLEPGGYGLLGPNGAGKTTLLNLLTGQLKPTLGRVRTLGMRPWNRAAMLRRLGVCPASNILLPKVSGFEWVVYLLELHGFGRREAKHRAGDALGRVGMTDAMHRRIGSYSKGMRQRTKIAQAMAHEPEFLVLDEPFDGLDPVGRHDMTQRLREWTREGRSLLLASHILHEVEAVADAFLLICNGRLLASGSAEEVRTLLVDLPSEIRVHCDRPAELSSALLAESLVEGLRNEDATGVVTYETRAPLDVYEALPRIVTDRGIRIQEIRSPDESLQALFETLMKIHRGEST